MIHKFTKFFLIIIVMLATLAGYAQNLLTNGDFESGGNGTGFSINSSFYHQINPPFLGNTAAGDFAVTSNPGPMNFNFISSTDRSGTGNMLVVDGAGTGGQYFWRAGSSGNGACGLTVGTTYTFSFWIKAISITTIGVSTQPQIEIIWNNASSITRISTNVVGTPNANSILVPTPAASAGAWHQIAYTFVATNGCVNIEIKDNNSNPTGNDFAVDDFSLLAPPKPLSVTSSITNPTCPSTTNGTIFAYGVGGSNTYTNYALSAGPTPAPNNATGQFIGLAPGTYTVTVTDSNGASASQIGIIVPNAPDLTLGATLTTVNACGSTTLTVSGGGPLGYNWSSVPADPTLTATGSSQTVSPAQQTVYTVTATTNTPNNLIYNGDFFLGNTGFTTDYTYYANNPTGARKAYGVVTNANSWEPSFSNLCKDHTTTTGNMMIVDGSEGNLGNDKVWCQTVPVTPGQNYTLSYWFQLVSGPAMPILEVLINGVSQGSFTPLAASGCTWTQKSYVWNSGANTTAEICFYDRNTLAAGNDFALDDISFARVNSCNLQKSVTINVTNPLVLTITDPPAVCASGSVNITAAAVTTGSTAGATLTYYTNSNATAASQITTAAASALTVSGTYYIKSTLGTCSVVKPVVVSISTGGTVAAPSAPSPIRYCVGSSAVALTATPLAGATLKWYDAATGGNLLPGTPTPSTLAAGNTSYFVTQTVGTCESPRTEVVVIVAKLTYDFFCDPSRVTTNPVTSVYFDWQNIASPPPVYNITYSINGGPTITATPTNLSHYEVLGVLPGQSVFLTITSANGFPCVPAQSFTCANCTTTTTPVFASIPTSICSGSVAPILPTTSDNGISGLWSPTTVSNTTGGSYVFTPNTTLFPCTSGTVTKGITVTTPPNAGTLNGTQNICAGTTTPFGSSVTGGTWSSVDPTIASVNSSSGVVTGVAAGTTTIKYTVNGTAGCSSTSANATRNITVTAPPSAGTLSGTNTICIGQNTTLIPAVSGGLWSTSSVATATVNASGVVTGVAAGQATITYTITGTGGCANATATRIVTVSAPPNAGTLSGTVNVCVGLNTTFFATVSGGSWSSTTPAIATVNATTGVITGVSPGSTSIVYTVSGTGGCGSVTASRTAIVTSPPSAGTLSGNQSICIAGTTTFIPTVSGGIWSSSDSLIASVTPGGVVTGNAAGLATITYTIPGTGGCPNATATRTVTVSAVPNAGTLNGNQAICIGFSATFNSTTPGGTWSSSAPAVATINNAGVVIGVTAGFATMTYSVTGSGGCGNGTATRTVTVTAAPNPGVLSGGQNICVGKTTTFQSTVAGGRWTSSDALTATIDPNSGLVTGIAGGSATMTYTVTGTGGCSNTNSTRIVNVSPNVLPIFTQVAPICNGDVLAPLPLTSTNGITGTWSGPLNNTSTTQYFFTPTPGLCALPTSMTIVVNQPVTPLFGLFAPLCQGATPPVLPTTSNNVPPITGTWSPPVSTTTIGSTIYTFTPTPGQCVVTIPPTTLALTVVPVLTPNFPAIPPFCEGTVAPILSNTSPNGVEGTWSPPIVSNTAPGNYLFTPNPDQCAVTQSLSVSLITRTVPDFPAIPAFCKGTPAPVLPATSPNGITGTWSPAVIDNTVSGFFPYLFIPDASECATPQTLYVTVIEPTQPGFFDLAICSGSIAPPLVNTSPNGVNGTWNPPVIDNIFSGTYLFTPDVGECAVSQTIDVTVNQYTLTSIDSFVTNYFDDNQVVTVLATNAGNYLYQLDFGPLQQSNVFQNVGSGIHTIKVIDANGCSNPLTGEVMVINYPKFFTPNNDTYNDTWNITGLKDQSDSIISIFDRHGKLLKQISPSGTGWDGTCNGQRMPSTDYWFTVEYTENGGKKIFKSHFSLKR